MSKEPTRCFKVISLVEHNVTLEGFFKGLEAAVHVGCFFKGVT